MKRLTKLAARLELKITREVDSYDELIARVKRHGFSPRRKAIVTYMRHEMVNYDRLRELLQARYLGSKKVSFEEYNEAVEILRDRANKFALYHMYVLMNQESADSA